MTPTEISEILLRTLQQLQQAGSLAERDLPTEVVVERPKNREHGDWATNVAMQLSGKFDMNPRAFAELMLASLSQHPAIEKVEIAGPGFINITLAAGAAGELAKSIVEAGPNYGHSDIYRGLKMNLEFVSANPTGPIHIGGTRWAAVGDSLARILQSQGAEVTREYYFNDHGAQIDRFARSLLARAKAEPAPDDGYAGQYIEEIANQAIKDETLVF